MATKKAQTVTGQEAAQAAQAAAHGHGAGTDYELPEGFSDARKKRADGFWKAAEGAIITGELLDRYLKRGKKNRRGQEQYYYLIRTETPTIANVEISERGAAKREYEERELPAGSVIAVDETADLRFQLEERATSDTSYDVYILCQGKEDIGDGQTMWRYRVGVKVMGPKSERATF